MSDDQPRLTASCRCGHVTFEITGAPILCAVCYCNSCRTAGRVFDQASGGEAVVDNDGGVDLVLYRKDRVAPITGVDRLREHRLKPDSPTRRMVATCCDTPMFLEFTKGHWLSFYRQRLPQAVAPLQMRVMTADRPVGVELPADLPNYAGHSGRFMWKLLKSWAAMGFRTPKAAW